jgi:Fe-S-cluster containining protein
MAGIGFRAVEPSDIFTCRKCGDCCKGYGGTYVDEKDIESIADFIHTDPESFVRTYCKRTEKMPLLAQRENDYCIFWDGQCTIHPVKPRMCRSWPFIESVLIDIKNWHIMAALCPGIRTDVSEDQVRECVKKALSNEK